MEKRAWMKKAADGLTSIRLALSIILPVWGIYQGPRGLNGAAALVLVAWTSDVFDGPLARKSGVTEQTWVGRHDLVIDMLLALGLLCFMCCAGLIPPLVALMYVLVWGAILWRYNCVTKPLGAAFQGLIYVWFGLTLLARRLLAGRVMLLWVLLNVCITRKRLFQRDVPRFLRGMRELARLTAPTERSKEQ